MRGFLFALESTSMTVCIGALCDYKNAVVLVADRMLTSGLAIEFEHPVKNKVTELSQNCLALTSGNALAYTELFTEVCSETSNQRFISVEQFVETIKNKYQELRKKKITERIFMPRGFSGFPEFYQVQGMGLSGDVVFPILSEIDRFDYGLQILVGGISPGGSHLYVVDDPGTSDCLDSIGFHAIGSGTNLALSALIAGKCHQELSVPDALLVALDAKITSENAPGVGAKTDISLIVPNPNGGLGLAIQFCDDDIRRLRDLCRARRDGDKNYESAVEGIITRNLAERLRKSSHEDNDISAEGNYEEASPQDDSASDVIPATE